jgi:hypothetical protein
LKTVPHGSATLNLANRPMRNTAAGEAPGPRSESGRTFRFGKWDKKHIDPVWTS